MQETLAAQDYQPANQSAEPCRTMEELKRIFGRGRDQAGREELHGHRPFGPRTCSLQTKSHPAQDQEESVTTPKVH